MRLATNYDRIHQGGAELIGVAVDAPSRQAAMAQRWGFSHTGFISDPGGEKHLQPLGLYDPDDRGGIALPGMLIITSDGEEVYRHEGRDFADRTNDEEVLDALTALQLEPLNPEPWSSDAEIPSDLKGFFTPEQLVPYYKGNMFAAVAISRRVADEASQALAKEHQAMSHATIEAWGEWSKH